MPLKTDEIMNLLRQLSEQENLRVTVSESAKGACMAGGGALLGGMLAGPVGLAIGGTAGSLYGWWTGSGKYKPVAYVIMNDLSQAQRLKLANSIKIIASNLQIEDILMLTSIAMGNASIQKAILLELIKFLRNECGLMVAA